MNRRSDQRAARAEARRERIAAGLSRKETRAAVQDAERGIGSAHEAEKPVESENRQEVL
jgi:hypothetical protein